MSYDNFRFHHPHHHLAGGHRGGPGHGRGGGHGRGFMGGDGFPPSRKLSSADLQLVVLALLAEQPAHGYELIKTLEERSGGFYAPSPGMIYPALTYLEEIGHAAVTQDGNRKLYTITPEGQAHLEANRPAVTAMLAALARIGGRMAEVREAYRGVEDVDAAASEELHRARHGLKHALMARMGATGSEARRIAKILDEAAAAILGERQ